MYDEPVLRVSALDVSYGTTQGRPGARVLHGVDLVVHRGERVAVVGESGSGKSTLARAILGMLPAGGLVEGGTVHVLRDELGAAGEQVWRRLRGGRIGYIPQDPHGSFDPLMRVGGHVAEAIPAHRKSGRAERRRSVEHALQQAGLPDAQRAARSYPHQLSGGMRQRALIGASLVNAPDLLIADEPTSALDATVQQRILDHLDARVREDRIGALIITHDFGVVARHADTVVVLQRGRVVETGAVGEVLSNPQHAYTRALLDAIPGASERSTTRGSRVAADLVAAHPLAANADGPVAATAADDAHWVHAAGVSHTYPGAASLALHPATISIGRGRSLAVVGESGSGKSTLGRIILGTLIPSAGQVTVGGASLRGIAGRKSRALRRRVQAVFQDPASSLDPRYTVERTLLEPLVAARIGTTCERADLVRSTLASVGLSEELLGARSGALSGGQCQRVALARALILEPDVLVCDEPVSALDVIVQRQILDLLIRIQRERDLTFLFISHDLGVVREIADEVIVMRHGRIVEHAPTEQLFAHPEHAYTQELIAAAHH
ncbi:dipeptide ABC transporter ATP-binding protein [Leucobacter celer]|uniref:dipeptide ABC transporter ATP-binding protein n=1 Tax=Leucobacter celer TaxID=668625 RepID=UPI0006A7E392|nr:ABC transporter ATP-binding protein [Leucobacter celer]